MKLHIFDIDETLCEDSGQITTDLILTLESMIEKNLVWFASARSYQTTLDAINNSQKLIKNSIMATQNGAVILQKGSIIEKNYLNTLELSETLTIIEMVLDYLRKLKYP